MKVARFAAASLVASSLAVLSIGFAACSGFSTEDAEARCDQEQEARGGGGCFDALEYDACVAAFEECGDSVTVAESCPVTFSCPE